MFSYLRLLSIISLLAITFIAVSAGMFFRNLAADDLIRLAGKSNANMAQGYANAVWKRYLGLAADFSSDDPSQLKNNPQVAQFARDTIQYFEQMPLVKVNIYNARGALLLSSNGMPGGRLLGNAASPDEAFVLGHYHLPQASNNVLYGKALQNDSAATLVQTIIPLHGEGQAGQPPDGALELLYDVSESWQRLFYFQLYGTGGVILIFALFLGIFFMAAARAEAIIARQHEANIELAEAAAAAKAENYEKSQFLANVSHELRTPLNAIIGFSEIMKNEVMVGIENEKYNHYINDIHSSGVHLLSLINDILDYSKAEAGKLEMEVSEVNAFKMIQNSMRMIAPRAEAAEVKLVDNLPKEQFIMTVDSKKFKQILLNLLSNAVKFTRAGGEVRVTGWRNVADDTFSFEVRDTGIGIAPKDIAIAMAPFGQVDNTLHRKYEGTGLGLPLTKKFVELMGGKFTIESQVGVGTTITFTLPRELKEGSDGLVKQL